MSLPQFRTEKYAIWYACERFGVRPPEVAESWDDNNQDAQANLIGYNQIRCYEEAEERHLLLKTVAKVPI